jgi:hypothetical protein
MEVPEVPEVTCSALIIEYRTFEVETVQKSSFKKIFLSSAKKKPRRK